MDYIDVFCVKVEFVAEFWDIICIEVEESLCYRRPRGDAAIIFYLKYMSEKCDLTRRIIEEEKLIFNSCVNNSRCHSSESFFKAY